MVLALCAAVFVLVTSRQLPAVVAAHFSGNGVADGFMPLPMYVALMLTLAVGLPVALVTSVRRLLGSRFPPINIPHREYWLAPERRAETVHDLGARLTWFGGFLLVFLCYVHGLVVLANLAQPPSLPGPLLIGGLVVFAAVVLAWVIALRRRFRREG